MIEILLFSNAILWVLVLWLGTHENQIIYWNQADIRKLEKRVKELEK